MGISIPNISELEKRLGIELKEREYSEIIRGNTKEDNVAIMWVKSLDKGFVGRTSKNAPPVWIYHKFKWGPHSWPVKWSDLPNMKKIDCGMSAALTTFVYQY